MKMNRVDWRNRTPAKPPERGLVTGVREDHALQTHGRSTVACLRVVRLNHLAQRGPRHDLLHRREEHIAPRRLAILFVLRVLVGGHGKGLLLHVEVNAFSVPVGDLISVALALALAIKILVHGFSRFVGLGMTDNPRGYTSNRGMRWHLLQDYATSSNLRSFSHPNVPEYLCTCANKHPSPDLWVAITASFPSATERYLLKYRHVVVDDRCFADHDTSSVINEYPIANDRCRMDVDGKDFGYSTLKVVGKRLASVEPKRMTRKDGFVFKSRRKRLS